MGLYCYVASLTIGAVRLLPEHLDLFTACNGCAGIGVALGGGVAWLADEDIAKGGIIGAVMGMALGAILALVQGSVHS